MRPIEVGAAVIHIHFPSLKAGIVVGLHTKFGADVQWPHSRTIMRHPLSQILCVEDALAIPKKKRKRRKEVIDDEIEEEIEAAEPEYRSRLEDEVDDEVQETEEQRADGDVIEEAVLSEPLSEVEEADILEYEEEET